LQTLGAEIENLFGDVLLAAAEVNYAGAFSGQHRTQLIAQ